MVFIADSLTGFCAGLLWQHELNLKLKLFLETVKRCSQKTQISQENTCFKYSIVMKLQINRVQLYYKGFRRIYIFFEYWEISHKSFFKEPFERLLLHKHSFCLICQHDLVLSQKRCHTYFLAESFLGLICRLATRLWSIF